MAFRPPPAQIPVVTQDIYGVLSNSRPWDSWFREIAQLLSPGVTGIVPLAKLTPGGNNGSLRFDRGILVEIIEPT